MTSLHCAHALLDDGFAREVRLTLAGGTIAAVETGVAPRAGEARAHLALPGMANLHSHAFQRAMAGLAEVRGPHEDTFWTWRETMYRFALGMSPDDVEAVAAQAYVEMLEAGFTRVGEFHYLHHDRDGTPYADLATMARRIAAAAGETGMGLTLLPVFYAHAQFGGVPPLEGQRRFVCDLDSFARLVEGSAAAIRPLAGATLGLAPHSLRAATPEEVAAVVAMAGGRPIHLHIAEQMKEVEDCRAWSGARPVEWLLDNTSVDARWCLIHATHMAPHETEGVARAGARAGLCPLTEANLGDGTFDGARFRAAGGAYGVGSDSNIEIGPARELRQLEYAQRLAARARNVMADRHAPTGQTLWREAAVGGARALGLAGGITVGAAADVVTLAGDEPRAPFEDPDLLLNAWIFGAQALVRDVYVAGERVVEAGLHPRREAIAARYAGAVRKLVA